MKGFIDRVIHLASCPSAEGGMPWAVSDGLFRSRLMRHAHSLDLCTVCQPW